MSNQGVQGVSGQRQTQKLLGQNQGLKQGQLVQQGKGQDTKPQQLTQQNRLPQTAISTSNQSSASPSLLTPAAAGVSGTPPGTPSGPQTTSSLSSSSDQESPVSNMPQRGDNDPLTGQSQQDRQRIQQAQRQQQSFKSALAEAGTRDRLAQLKQQHKEYPARVSLIQQKQKTMNLQTTRLNQDLPKQNDPLEQLQSGDQQQQLQQVHSLQDPGRWDRIVSHVGRNKKWYIVGFLFLALAGLIGAIVSGYFMAKQGSWAKIFKKQKKEKRQQLQQQPFGSARAGGEDAALAAMKSGNPALHPGPFSIAFVAGWCSHCRAMKPALEHAVAQHNKKGLPPAYIVQVDNASFSPDKKAAVQAAMAAQRVDGLPTILRFDGASMHAADAYRGDRSAASLAAFFSKTRAA